VLWNENRGCTWNLRYSGCDVVYVGASVSEESVASFFKLERFETWSLAEGVILPEGVWEQGAEENIGV
jgi:hypothetical protein